MVRVKFAALTQACREIRVHGQSQRYVHTRIGVGGRMDTLRVPDRAALQARLQAAGIPTAVHYPVPLNEQPAYAHLGCPDCTPVARQMAREVMSLPMHPDLREVDQGRIVAELQGS